MNENKAVKMSSISQFRNTITDVKHQAQCVGYDEENEVPIMNRNAKLPTLTFEGTIKLHGTNASVCFDGENLRAQSKENILTVEKDNFGFAFFVESNKEYFIKTIKPIMEDGRTEFVCIYGEWAGKGIQKSVGISEIDKTFFMFGIKYKLHDDDVLHWAPIPNLALEHIANGERIRSIYEFPTYEIIVDFENPAPAQNKMLEIVNEIDLVCPVGKHYGHEGHGEGVVWVTHYNGDRHIFKTKGESHSKSKVKTLSPVDEVREQNKRDFANYACTPGRLEQAWDKTFEVGSTDITPNIALTGTFLRAVISDVMKEEMDILAEKGLEPKDVNKFISDVARPWFLEQLDIEAGL